MEGKEHDHASAYSNVHVFKLGLQKTIAFLLSTGAFGAVGGVTPS